MNYTLEPIEEYELEPLETETYALEPEEPSVIKDIVLPTAKVATHTVTSMAQAPLSALEAIPKWVDEGGNYFDVASKVMEERQKKIDEAYLTTAAEQKGAENVGKIFEHTFGKVPKGWKGLYTLARTGDLQKATDVIEGRESAPDITVGGVKIPVDPILGTVTEAAGMFAPSGLRGAKSITRLKKTLGETDFTKPAEVAKTFETVMIKERPKFKDIHEQVIAETTAKEATTPTAIGEGKHVTPELKAEYDAKIAEAKKGGVEAFEKRQAQRQAEADLIAEAKKYKTAEEFVEAQKRYYHGTVGEHKLTKTTKGDLGEGLYLTDPHEAHYFASQKRQAFGGKPAILEYEATPQKTLTLGVGGDGEIAYDFYKKGLTGALGKFARDNGYDAIYRPLGVGGDGIELMVLSPKNIKFKNRFYSIDDVIYSQIEQKSQLTDIWNRAQNAELLTEAFDKKTATVSLETAEAMVKGGATKEFKFAGETSINLERLDTTLDVKNFSDGLAKASGLDKKTLTWEDSVRVAEELGWDSKALLNRAKKSGGINAGEAVAMRQIHANSLNDLFNTIRDLPIDPTKRTDAIRFAVLDKINNHIQIMKATSEMTSEVGRTLNIFKKAIKDNPDFIKNKNKDMVFRKMFETNGSKQLTDAMINDLKRVDFNDPLAVKEILQKYHQAKWGDKIYEAWLNGILSAPTTHVANIIGNTLAILTKVPETIAAGVTKGKLPMGEVGAEIVGMAQGFKDGARAAVRAFQTGMPSDMISKVEAARYTAIKGKTGEYIRIPTRALTAMDEFFKTVVYRSELNRSAYLKAKQYGGNISKTMAEILNDPVKYQDIFSKAHSESLYRTFNNPLGEWGNAIMGLRDKWLPARFVVPFIRTPVNIAKFTLERTPFNFAKIAMDYKNGKIAPSQLSYELAKPIVGSLISTAVVFYVLDGTITGAAPKDKTERELLYATGWQPYSIKIGNKYYSYNRLEPIGSIIGITADMVGAGRDISDKEINEIAGNVMFSISKNLTSKTFMSGVTKFLDALSGDPRYAEAYIEQLAGSLIPSFVGAAARSVDPYVRDPETPLEAIKARIPYLSETVPYRIGAYDKPVELEGGLWNFVSPIMVTSEKEDTGRAKTELTMRKAKIIKNRQKRLLQKEKERQARLGG